MPGAEKEALVAWSDLAGRGIRDDPAPERLRYDVWSNIHYGYVGRAHGIPARILDWAQRKFGGVSDKADDLSVEIGVRLWDDHPTNLTITHLRNAVRAAMPEYRRYGDAVIPGLYR